MKGILLTLLLSVASINCFAEKLPSNLSREPNCIKNSYCLKEGDVYVDNSILPKGFSREPDCNADIKVICVSKVLYLEAKELIVIKNIIKEKVKNSPPAGIKIDAVMDNIVLVSVYKRDYFGIKLLLEKQNNKGWVIIKEEHSLY